MSRSFSIWLSALSMVVALVLSSGVRAEDDKRITILTFEGPSAKSVQGQVLRALKHHRHVELVSARDVANTADRLGNDMTSEADFRELGEALELSAFIEGKVAKKGRNLQVTVSVRNAATGEVIHEETWTRRRSELKKIRPLVWDALAPAISESSAPTGKPKPKKGKPVPPPPEPTEEELPEEELPEEEEVAVVPPPPPPKKKRPPPEPEEAPEEAPEPAPKAPKKGGTHAALIASIGPRLSWRTLKYEGATNLNSYKHPAGSPFFSLPIAAQYYPGAHFSNAWYSNLGLDFEFDYNLGGKSSLDGRELKTTAYDLGVGAIYRIPTADFEPRFRLGYVRQAFIVEDGSQTMLPDVEYDAIRLGAGTAIKFVDWFAFDVNFAYLFVLGTGELESPDYADNLSTKAWEAGAAFAMRFRDVYGLRIGIDYRRYKYDFSLSDNSDTDLVDDLPKTGTDGYLRVGAYFTYSLPGVL